MPAVKLLFVKRCAYLLPVSVAAFVVLAIVFFVHIVRAMFITAPPAFEAAGHADDEYE